MKLYIGSNIEIFEPTPEIQRLCESELVVDNPEYLTALRLGKWIGNIPKRLYLYERNGDRLVVPYGFKNRLGKVPHMWEKYPPISSYSVDYKSTINLYDYQETAVNKMIKAINGVVVMPCGGGKGLPVDAKICTPTGWKRNGDLCIGDEVIGSNGKATLVTNIFDRGEVEAYKITFSDGVETICDKDHLWTVQKQSQRAESGNWYVMNTQSIYAHYQHMRCRSQYLYIPIVEPVEFNSTKVQMSPWLLGFLIGDGCFQPKTITVSIAEKDLVKKVADSINAEYGESEELVYKSKYDWRFRGNHVLRSIEELGLSCKHSYEKFIPKEYLYNSVDVRLAILQGLFDADGHISNGMIYEYSTSSRQLADDVVFIVQSLGGTAKVKEKTPTYTYNGENKVGRKAYRIFFKLYKFEPFTSKKHFAAYRKRKHYNKAYRIIKKIEPCDPIISRCITVDAEDQLYVTENFVVTHNTQTALECVARLGLKTLWLTHTQDLLNQSMERAKNCFDCDSDMFGIISAGKVNISKGITFATVQTMCKLDLSLYRDKWAVIVVDECLPSSARISTPDGKKPIKDLRGGDLVLSYNTKHNRFEYKRVTHLFKFTAHDIVKVKLSNGKEIVATSNHPFYTDSGKWVNASDLRSGDYVMQLLRVGARQEERRFFEWVRVDSVEVQEQTSDGTFDGLCEDGYVYNIEVEDNNNYFADDVLVHNCQHCCGSPTRVSQFYRVINNLYAPYKFGLTATPSRTDGLEKSMFALIGDKITEVSRDKVKDTTCPVKIKTVKTEYYPDVEAVLNGDGTIDYAALTSDLISDGGRFDQVMDVVNAECKSFSMVLANRVQYLQDMSDMYKGKSICISAMGTSKKARQERKEALAKLNAGEIDCIFATYQLAAEGLDCPNLRYVVFATPEKNERTVTQAVGRVARKAAGKEYGTVIDFVDDFGLYKGWASKRRGYYKKLGCISADG